MGQLCEGRVCVVTGGARGIGREYARMLSRHGAKVVVNDLGSASDGSGADKGLAQQAVDEIEAEGGTAIANSDDVSSWDGAKSMIQQAIDVYGQLDVLINNAGILRDRMLVNMEEAEWDAVIRVHLKGTFAPARHAAAYWRERSKAGQRVDARLINTASISGLYGNPGQANYGAAKAGVAAFTIIASRELQRYGVTVNCIAPAGLTRMTENLDLGQRMDPKWVAPIVTWLASRESGGVTGRVFEASGEILAIAEGWHRGPTVEPIDDPTALGPIVAEMVRRARNNAGIDGQDFDGGLG